MVLHLPPRTAVDRSHLFKDVQPERLSVQIPSRLIKSPKRQVVGRCKRGAYSWESIPFYTVEEKFPLGHGEKSVFLINEHMRLTRDEALAIRFHMGDFTDRNTGKAYEMCSLALQLHIADLQATYLDENDRRRR